MKSLCFACLLVTSVLPYASLAAESGLRERNFLRALELFDAAKSPEDYRESARTFEAILTDGLENGAVYYNLGNAYYRAGDYGKAIINYRKAKRFRPGDAYLTANLDQALAVAPGRLPSPPRPWWTHVLFWTDWISFPMKVKLFAWGLSIAALFTTVAAWFRFGQLLLPIVILVAISLAVGVDAALSEPGLTGIRTAVITGETVARKGTGNSYEPAFDQPLKDGAEFRILAETNDWTLGRFEGVGDGWVRNEFVAR